MVDKKINIAFNGFGRIGRNSIRKLINDPKYNIVAINARTTVGVRAHLFKYDSIHGPFEGTIETELDNLIINDHVIPNFDRSTPKKLPWEELDVDFGNTVLDESTVYCLYKYYLGRMVLLNKLNFNNRFYL